MGSIESISLDWHEGVFIETEASPPAVRQTVHGPMPALDVPVGVYYSVHCCLCEWAYCDAPEGSLLPSSESVAYGYKTPDIEEALGWARGHRSSKPHVDAVHHFRAKKRQMGNGSHKHV